MKIDRLLAITLHLINRKKVTARELADRFEVSLRTIQRDMDTLALAGIPIYADRGKDGGYCIIDTYTINRHYFSPKELTALTSLMGKLNALLGQSELKITEEKLLNLSSDLHKSEAHQPLIMDVTPWGINQATRKKFGTVYRAVEESQVLTLRYASAGGEISKRAIEPLSLIIKGTSWYIYAFCRLRQATRIFKLTRIMDVNHEAEYFNPNLHPPYQEKLFHPPGTNRFTLFVLKFSPSAQGRVTDYYNADNLHFMPDGNIIGFFPFPEDEWVYSWILSFGPLVEVLEPPHAKERIKKLLLSTSQKY